MEMLGLGVDGDGDVGFRGGWGWRCLIVLDCIAMS